MADFVSPNGRVLVSADAVQSPDTSDVVVDVTHLAQSVEQDTPMAAVALRLVETRGEYHASTNSATPNVPSPPMRGFTQVDNAYFDGLFGVVSPSAYYCLMYIVRSTIGYRNASGARRECVRLSFKQLGQELGLSRNTALKAIQELETARIIGSDADERARTQIRAYFLLPIECWNRETLHAHSSTALTPPTSAENALVEDETTDETTSAENDLATTSPNFDTTSAENGLVGTQTSPKIGHLRNKEKKEKRKKDSLAAGAAGPTTAQPRASPAQPSKDRTREPGKPQRERKITPEDQAYRLEVLARVAKVRGVARVENWGQEWKWAGELFRWPGGPPSLDVVEECFALTLKMPQYDAKELSIAHLVTGQKHLGAFLRSGRDAYAKAVERSRQAANGEFEGGSRNGANGTHRTTGRAAGSRQTRGPLPVATTDELATYQRELDRRYGRSE